MQVTFTQLREAIESSWKPDTAYQFVEEKDNLSLGQCYVTAKIVQEYFPELEIIEGIVKTPIGEEKHFWNRIEGKTKSIDVDLTWQQFPAGSRVIKSWMRDRHTLNDSKMTQHRLELLRSRVKEYLVQKYSDA